MKFKSFINLFFYSAILISSLFIQSVNADTKSVGELVNSVENRYGRLHTELQLAEKETGDQRLISQLKVIHLLKFQKAEIDAFFLIYEEDTKAVSKEQLNAITTGIERFIKEEQAAYHLILEQIKEERRSMDGISGNDLIMKEVVVANKQTSLDVIMQHMYSMGETQSKFQSDAQDNKLLIKAIRSRAIESSLILSYVGKEHKALSSKMLGASDYEKETLNIEIRRLEIKKESAATTLKVAIDILDMEKVNVDSFRTTLISNVGAEGDELFQISVISRIFNNWLDLFVNWLGHNAVDYSINLIVFFLILSAFYIFANFGKKVVTKATLNSKLNFSKLLRKFIIATTGRIIIFIGFMVAFSYLGIELAPLITGFGVAGIVIGFALQGTLSNFASGVMMLLYRPFDVGDMILAGGEQGTVEKLSLVNTTIHTIDNRRVVLPNNLIWEGTIT
ncbi:MAG: mechanosensitive ion channel, partial [Psychromonas sp.]|nr:mechanosensitive ion channel [Psychromonas sp.]